jgi:opine dehydrogenase
MTSVAILGAGAGGAAAAVELSGQGHDVRLWARTAATLAPFIEAGGVAFEGVLGDGLATPQLMTADLVAATAGAEVLLVCLPTPAHAAVARMLAEARVQDIPVVLNPGHTGGALEVAQTFRDAGALPPPIAEFSTLTYVARKNVPARVTISGRAERIWAAALPGGAAALAAAQELYPAAQPCADVLATGLANVNLVLHPPGAVLGAAWVEATGGDFLFYAEGVTPGVARVMRRLDDERLAVARAFGHALEPLAQEMAAIGTADRAAAAADDLVGAICQGAANAKITAPDSLDHRYYREDFGHGLLPFLELARVAGVDTPVAAALLEIGTALVGPAMIEQGRTAARMGIDALDRKGLLALVRGGATR